MDLAANFCYGTVTTAPSPAASGTSMVVTLLGGATLPATPWNALVWITGEGSLRSNSEIVRVTNVSMAGAAATLTMVRAQEGSSARTIVVGDQFGVGPTAKFVTDLIAELAAKSPTLNDTGAGNTLIADDATGQVKKLIAGANVTLTPSADAVEVSVSAPGTGDVVGPAGATAGNFALFDGPTGKLIEDAGISPGDIAASISAAQAASLQKSANLSDVANAATAFGNIKQAATTSATGVVELATDGESAANIVPQANDSRLSNARTPTAHAASHITGGSDIIPEATTTAVGLAPAATAPAAGLLNVLAIANGETVRTDKALFDTTNPEPAGSAAPGTAIIAARRDHVHAAQTTVSGNAGTATALQNARTIDGVSFNGTANITVIAPATNAAASKATPVDADEIPLVDSAASFVLKKLTWANLKATAKTYFDTLYQPLAAALTALASGTISSSLTFDENTALILDAALSADGKYCGIAEPGTAGATLAFGDLVYQAAADSRWELVDADAESTSGPVRIGMVVLAAAADGDPTRILTYGKIRADSKFPSLTISAPAYAGTTAGAIQTAQPSGTDDVIRIVGHGVTADELFFNPSNDYMVHT